MAVPTLPFDKLVEKVKFNLGRVGDTTMDDYVPEWLNSAQKLICTKQNFWFMHTSTTLTLSTGTGVVNLPTDFKDEDSVWYTHPTTGEFVPIDPMDEDDYRKEYNDTDTGEPLHYIVRPTTLFVRPLADADYTLTLVYWAFPQDMTIGMAEGVNKLMDNYPDALEAGATYMGFRYLSEFEDAGSWKGIFDGNIADLISDNVNRVLPDEFVMPVRTDVKASTIGTPKNR